MKSARRVLIIVQNLPVPFDRRVWQEACELVAAGYIVSVICPKGKGYDKAYEHLQGVHIYRHSLPLEANGALGYFIEYIASLFWEFVLAWKVFFLHGFDVIHACNPPDTIFLIGGFFKYCFGKKFLFDHHDLNPELYEAKFGKRGFFYRLLLLCERMTFAVADVSIATNNSYERIAIARGKMKPQSVFVVRSGPSLERMKILPPTPSLKMGKRFLVGYLGVIGQQEGIDYLIEAARIIVHELRRDDIHFMLVGDGPALGSLKKLAEEKDVTGVMTFAGLGDDPKLLAVLNTADVCVSPDEVNAMNDQSTMNKVMEYMALAKPIVQFDLTEGRFCAGDASLYAKANDAHDFAAKIIELLDDPQRRERMGKLGRQRIENEFAWPHEAPKLLAAYDAVFATRKSAPALPMDVVLVGPFPSNPSIIKGGVQAAVYGLAQSLKQQSSIGSVTVIAIPVEHGKVAKPTVIEGIDVTYLNAPNRFLASSIIHLGFVIRTIRKQRNPVVNVHGTGLLQAALCAYLRLKRLPFAWTLHGITEKETHQRYREHPSMMNFTRHVFYTALERFLLRICPHIMVDTEYVKDEVATGHTVHVTPHGIRAQEFTGQKRDPHLVLSVGVIHPRKGHHLTLEAFAPIKEEIPQARLIIAGALSSLPYYQQLKQQAKALGVDDAVEFAVNLQRSEIVSLLGHARVFALHSQEESQGLALCEALAAGLPVVATRVGGIPYVVEDDKTGFLVPYGDVTAYAEAILRLLTDNALHAQMAKQAALSGKRFDWDNITGPIVEVYRKAC